MAQLRQDYEQFVQKDAAIVVIGPEDAAAFAAYWEREELPFIGLPDPDHTVADRYGQEVKWLKLGRVPALMIIDKQGIVRYAHYGDSMRDIPANADVLAQLDQLNASDAAAVSDNVPDAAITAD